MLDIFSHHYSICFCLTWSSSVRHWSIYQAVTKRMFHSQDEWATRAEIFEYWMLDDTVSCINLIPSQDFSLAPSLVSSFNHKHELSLYLLFAGLLVAKVLLCAISMGRIICLIWFANPRVSSKYKNHFHFKKLCLWIKSIMTSIGISIRICVLIRKISDPKKSYKIKNTLENIHLSPKTQWNHFTSSKRKQLYHW